MIDGRPDRAAWHRLLLGQFRRDLELARTVGRPAAHGLIRRSALEQMGRSLRAVPGIAFSAVVLAAWEILVEDACAEVCDGGQGQMAAGEGGPVVTGGRGPNRRQPGGMR